ncbi:hypothetical protein MTX78_15070 [Hymenobacter tibetensis]|uniref:Uncharacterized protein n=1 Tax=Hymenobacter tibetensis TaxID=497967 RepID=A0ABY4CT56_9BACT|nr:hypothetical protein [Hymenobacter tibetensis]UOG73445.1 hypothetical protein MTX78_15070 [Hymenobacter tibetensis]
MTILHVPEQHRKPSDEGGLFLRALAWVLLRVVPKASPDYDRHFKEVAYWLVEVDAEGKAEREIGFNTQHEPVFFAPTNRNCGLWTDSDRIFSREQFESRDDFPFDSTWNNLYAQTLQGTRSL